MRAVAFSTFGTPDVLSIVELPEPVPREGEVVVRVLASTVNPTDVMMRDGRQAALMKDLVPPFIAGVEFCGTVEDAPGNATYTRGLRVIGLVNARRPEGGSHAEFIRVPTASLTGVPARMEPSDATTIPMNGLTAKRALEMLGLPRGSTILVTGGAGAVGGYVIELARQFGFNTVADSRKEDRDLLTRFGANTVVPRGDGMVEAVRARYRGGLDGLVDAGLIGAAAASLVRDGGSAVSLRRSNPITDQRLRATYVNVFDGEPDNQSLQWLASLTELRQLTPRVACKLPIEEAAQAHRLVERGGLRGRVVLTFD